MDATSPARPRTVARAAVRCDFAGFREERVKGGRRGAATRVRDGWAEGPKEATPES
jgi:hypothetical protein